MAYTPLRPSDRPRRELPRPRVAGRAHARRLGRHLRSRPAGPAPTEASTSTRSCAWPRPACSARRASARSSPHAPLSGHPVWVDDPHFNLLYHVRHTALPLPGDERRLKRLFGRIMSQKLDRSKPMWELWIVEGLEGGRFAVISKVHHCLIDGISGVDLLSAFMGTDPEHRPEHGRPPLDPAPGAGTLEARCPTRSGAACRCPARVAREFVRSLRRPGEALGAAAHTASGFGQGLRDALTPASVDVAQRAARPAPPLRLDALRSRRRPGGEDAARQGTLNDVVLGCVAGAVRRFLSDRGEDVSKLHRLPRVRPRQHAQPGRARHARQSRRDDRGAPAGRRARPAPPDAADHRANAGDQGLGPRGGHGSARGDQRLDDSVAAHGHEPPGGLAPLLQPGGHERSRARRTRSS